MTLRAFFLLASLAMGTLSLSARAEEGVLCLQEQMTALGHDPGKPDGEVGPATRRALAAYESADGPLAARKLDRFSAIVFCRELGLRDPAVARFWPSDGRRVRVEVAGDGDDDLRAALLAEASDALAIAEKLFSPELAAPVDIVIGSNAREIAERARTFTAIEPGAVDRAASRLCRQAPAYGIRSTHLPGVILFCHRPETLFLQGFYPKEIRNQLGRMLAMEIVTQLTGDAATGSDADYYRRNGPMWLIVGAMQLLQREVDGAITPLGKQNAAERLRAGGVPHPKTMELYQSNLEDPEGLGRTGLLVTDDLTRDTGLAPVAAFYTALGTGLSVDEAFSRAFGETLEEVYADYP